MTVATLRRLTTRRATSEREWREGIKQAHAEGMSLRAIAREVGLSHVRVLQIVRE